MPAIETTPELVRSVYARLARNVETRARAARPTAQLRREGLPRPSRRSRARRSSRPGAATWTLRPDRVAMQDATAQMALLQFMLDRARRDGGAHHRALRPPDPGARRRGVRHARRRRTRTARSTTSCARASARYGIGFWGPGAGIIHQVVLEKYAFPGGMMIGTDSHTPNAGGLGMFACGVGGADAVDVMAGFPWEVLCPTARRRAPHRQARRLDGAEGRDPQGLRDPHGEGRHQPRDRVLRPRRARRSRCTGKGTITNMGAELGATTSIFPFDERMATYLSATGRKAIADLAQAHAELLRADPEVEAHPERFFDAGGRDRSRQARAARRGPAHARSRAAGLAARGRREGERLSGSPELGADRELHELVLRGSRARRRRRAAGARARRAREDGAVGHAGLGADPPDDPARRPARRLRGDRRRRARERLRPVHRPVEARRREGRRRELDPQLLQPQLQAPQRRQREHLLLHRQPRDRGGLRARGSPRRSIRCTTSSRAATASASSSRRRRPRRRSRRRAS